MIKYRSALNSNGELVNIDQIKRDENEGKEKYRCLSCGNELITKLGDVKIHHFAHKQTINCNGETYLHELGKKIFYNEYTACLRNKTPFSLEFYRKKICNLGESEFGRKCYINLELVPFDLTLYFNEIQIEKKDGDFIPDLKLSQKSGKEVIYIEIAVTHLSTEKKLNSQNRIVEIKVNDERDLDVIKQHKLSIKQSKILFKNFEIKKTEGNFCNGNCQCSFDIFLVYQSGKVVLLTKSLSEISNMLKRLDQKIIYQHLSRYVEGSEYKFKYLIAKA